MKLRLLFVLLMMFPGWAAAATLHPESITRYSPALAPTLPANGYPNQALVGDFYRHVMVFDLSGLSGTVVSATLSIAAGYGSHVTVGTTRSYNVWDVTSPIDDIARRVQGGPAADYYNDIGSGVLYGTTSVGVTPTNGANPLPSPGVTVDLQNGLTDITQSLGGKIAFGGTSPETFYMFSGASALDQITLELELNATPVPLPAGGALLVLGLGAFPIVRRFRRRSA